MPRLYLIVWFILFSFTANSQDYLRKYLDFAQEQYEKGDYYYAATYYQKAMEIDSNSVEIIWKYAETMRAYKEYRKAEYYYAKVYDREESRIYPASLLYLGLMQKQNGKYDAALETFKKAKKKYYKDKKGYLYLKSKRELASTIWAKSALIDTLDVTITPLPETVNSKNSEFGHLIHDNHFIFSSLRADSISANEEVYTDSYKTSLYQSKKDSSHFATSEQIKALLLEDYNTGNGTFSLDGNRYYFSRCTEKGYNYQCKIMVAQYSNNQWTYLDTLGEIINAPGSSTTMPCIANLDGDEVLIFASDREGGKGGLDLYFSKIRNGNQYSKVRSINTLNSPDNEITPWWDQEQQRLYFSSSWHDGFGGYDIYYAPYNGSFQTPVNVGIPANSSANDLYYFREKDTAYLTSNRIGVLYSKNPTCCSDIFSLIPPAQEVPKTPEETLEDLNKRLPVTLYFHNDIPNPRSRDTTTTDNYIDTYQDYTAMLDQYKKEYSLGLSGEKSAEAKEDIENFFMEYVDKGVSDLQLFRDLLLKELDAGARINVTVKGFASPLAKTDYNVNLTKRRIASLLNYLREYDRGVFVKYMDGTAENGGKVVFSHVPFGEYTANQITSDNPNDVQNSVYSRAAAIERKIEIQSVTYLEEKREMALTTEKAMVDLGKKKQGERIEAHFLVRNTSANTVELDEIEVSCPCVEVHTDKTTLLPGEQVKIQMRVNTSELTGLTVQSIAVKAKGDTQALQLYLSAEIAP